MALVAVACGLSADDSPRVIEAQELPPELRLGQLPTPTPGEASLSGPGAEQVHMVQNGRLVTVQRQIVDTPELLIEILLGATFPSEAADGIRSALDFQTRVQDIDVNTLFDVAIVDLAPGSLDPNNSEQRIAFAQIVYTLTSLPSIDSVQFVQTDPANPEAGAVDLAVQTDDGTKPPGTRVTRENFALLSPSATVPQPAFDILMTTPTPTPDPDAPQLFDLPVWMLDRNDDLTTVSRSIERSPDALLIAVIEGTRTDEREPLGLRSAIPPDALADPVSIDNFEVADIDEFGFETLSRANIATVDLRSGSLPTVDNGDERYLAAAQIVYTLTGLEEIDQVVFSVDGVPIPMPSDRGLTLPFDPNIPRGLRPTDYANALPQPDSAEPGTIDSEAAPTATPTPGG